MQTIRILHHPNHIAEWIEDGGYFYSIPDILNRQVRLRADGERFGVGGCDVIHAPIVDRTGGRGGWFAVRVETEFESANVVADIVWLIEVWFDTCERRVEFFCFGGV